MCMCRLCLVGREREKSRSRILGLEVCDWEGNWELGLRDNVESEEEEEKDNLEHGTGKLEDKKRGTKRGWHWTFFMVDYNRELCLHQRGWHKCASIKHRAGNAGLWHDPSQAFRGCPGIKTWCSSLSRMCWGGLELSAMRERVDDCWGQPGFLHRLDSGNLEGRVDFHGCRKPQADGPYICYLFHLEWILKPQGQLPWLHLEQEILGGQPDPLSRTIHWGRSPAPIGLPVCLERETKKRCVYLPPDISKAPQAPPNSGTAISSSWWSNSSGW